MKKSLTFFLLITILFYSCNSDDDITIVEEESSNNQIEELDNLLLEIQEELPKFVENAGKISSKLTRLDYMYAGHFYENIYLNSFNSSNHFSENVWNIAYQSMLPTMAEAQEIAEELGFNKHLGVVKVIRAYTLITLVNLYGDVPYSEISNPNPHVDSGASIYASALTMLDEAITAFNESGTNLENDIYYNNNFSKWIKLANTLKLETYINTRLIDGSAMKNFQAILNSGNYITNSSDDFVFRYGVNSTILSTHPAYENDYQPQGVASYRSNWLMNELLNKNDPRRRYYFYRQNNCTPGGLGLNEEICEVDPMRLFCSEDSAYPHYIEGMAFCWVNSGYWGRDHGFSDGIPPDTFQRTAIGVYPAAGTFDDNDFLSVTENLGGLGVGITPIMLASWVDFMQAEMALANKNTGVAENFMQAGMLKSVDKVMSFVSLDPEVDTSFIPTGIDVSSFINLISNEYNDTGGVNNKWNVFAKQVLVSHYGNGIGAYNFYRRTGYPFDMQYHVNPNAGPFVRSLFYPDVALEGNTNMEQKPNAEVQVFWDNNNSYPAFPYSN